MLISTGRRPITNQDDLVKFIQDNFADPKDTIPPPPAGRDTEADTKLPGDEEIWRDLSPLERAPVPDWLVPGDGVLLKPGERIQVLGPPEPPAEVPVHIVEVLAYYLPFHFYRQFWGVYIRARGILHLVSVLASSQEDANHQEMTDLAWDVLFHHEMFHFFSEIACSRAEIVLEGSLYTSHFHDRWATALEEALSNANAVRKSLRGRSSSLGRTLKDWMRRQGPGYRDFHKCLAPSNFRKWCRVQAIRMVSHGTEITPRSLRAGSVRIQLGKGGQVWGPLEFLFGLTNRLIAPVYFVTDAPNVQLSGQVQK
ncbi:MAG: hypothetical protein WHX93_02310 [bacterium]